MSFKADKSVFVLIVFCMIQMQLACCNASEIKSVDQVAFVFTGEENGYIKPCGCTEGQSGGIKRRYGFIEHLKGNGNIVLPVSTGDIAGNFNRQNEIKTETFIKAMEIMGYIVHNIGEKDIAMNYDMLRYLTGVYNVPFISSNINISGGDGEVIAPYLIKSVNINKGNLDVGFLGILSPDLVDDLPDNIEIIDPVSALRPLVEKLRDEVDILILLAHAEIDETITIAGHFPGLDLVVTGHDMDDSEILPAKNGNPGIISTGKFGKYAGLAIVSPSEKNKSSLNRQNFQFDLNMVPLNREFDIPSEMDVLISNYKNIVKDEDLSGNHRKIRLGENREYTGNLVCGTCHMSIFLHWKTTKHAVAYNTLQKNGDQFDPECVRCHVVGYDYTSGFESIETTSGLAGVGCESCHGSGSEHVIDTSKIYGEISEDDCLKCHDPENSSKFEYNSYRERIKHPVVMK